jgi:hypothetical protein
VLIAGPPPPVPLLEPLALEEAVAPPVPLALEVAVASPPAPPVLAAVVVVVVVAAALVPVLVVVAVDPPAPPVVPGSLLHPAASRNGVKRAIGARTVVEKIRIAVTSSGDDG